MISFTRCHACVGIYRTFTYLKGRALLSYLASRVVVIARTLTHIRDSNVLRLCPSFLYLNNLCDILVVVALVEYTEIKHMNIKANINFTTIFLLCRLPSGEPAVSVIHLLHPRV